MSYVLIYILFLISGACGLIYQLLWVRQLSLIFGNTTYATSSILTAFMGGLALGSYWLGKYSDGTKSPLKLYAKLEIGIGISAIAILFLYIPLSDSVYTWVFRTFGQNGVVFNLMRFVLSIFILIIPTTLMGGTLPVISKFIIRESKSFGKKIGTLYAINTLGGVAGAFLTGYHLIRLLGGSSTYWIAISANFALAFFALLINRMYAQTTEASVRRESKRKKIPKKPKHVSPPVQGSERIRTYSPQTARIILWLFGLAGFASLAYEVVWTRALLFNVSSTIYSFTIILVTFLTGITLGSMLMARWVDRVRNLIYTFGLFEICIALTAILSIPLLQNMHTFQRWLLQFMSISSWNQVTFMLFIVAFIILVLPTIFMGAAFPVVNRIYVKSIPQLGRGVGNVYMANTVGAIIGSFVSGFVLLPVLGISGSILLLAVLYLVIGGISLFFEAGFKQHFRKLVPLPLIGILLFVLINSLFFTSEPLFLDSAGFKRTKLLYHEDTPSATLCALEKAEDLNIWGENVKYLNINGHNTAHTTFADIVIHKMLAHLPALLHPQPENALVIGFGFGNTCQSFLQYDEIKRVDCVELLEQEKESAKFFTRENQGVFEDPRFNFIVNDGRNYVLATDRKYDIISINAVDPKFSPTLYTNDFYELCYQRLNPDGEIVAWLPLYGMTLEEVLSLIKSFVEVFPHASLWYNNPEHLLMLGSRSKQMIDCKTIVERLQQPGVRQSLAEIRLENPYSLLATFFAGSNNLDDLTRNAPLHSDDHPIVEFSQVATTDMLPEVYVALAQKKESILPLCKNLGALASPDTARSKLEKVEQAMATMLQGLFQYRIAANNPQAYANQANDAVQKMAKALTAVPENKFNLLFFVDWVYHSDLKGMKPFFEQAIIEEPAFAKAHVLLGLESAEQNDWATALAHYEDAISINPDFVSARLNAGVAFTRQKEWNRAITEFEKVVGLDPENAFAHSALSQVYYMQGDYQKAIAQAEKSIDILPDIPNYYFNLGMMLEKNNQLKQAIKAFEKGLELAPNDLKAYDKLIQLKQQAGE
ncbi:fused MFS/spermidine synthase [candidate division KSB1 bacterium]|nr:fused MFS/spermidine synthase [candidate division KSB1 bacterium]